MQKRPVPVLVVGWLFVLSGVIGIAYHAAEFDPLRPFHNNGVWVLGIRLLAIVGGVLLLKGYGWARWLLIAWLGYHVILSATHSKAEFATHCLFLAIIAILLFRPGVSAYFQGRESSM